MGGGRGRGETLSRDEATARQRRRAGPGRANGVLGKEWKQKGGEENKNKTTTQQTKQQQTKTNKQKRRERNGAPPA